MNKREPKHIIPIIFIVMLAGFFATAAVNALALMSAAWEDIQGSSKLAAAGIYGDISNETTKPVYVASTMANNSFLQDWIEGEAKNAHNAQYIMELDEYFDSIWHEFDFETVFLASIKTGSYYRYDGKLEKASAGSFDRAWFDNFLDKNVPYDITIDTDALNNNKPLIFVNTKMERDGETLGAIGIGMDFDAMRQILLNYEQEYGINAYIVDKSGTTRISVDSAKEGSPNEKLKAASVDSETLGDIKGASVNWYKKGFKDECLVVRYLPRSGWYIVVDRGVTPFERLMWGMLAKDLLIAMIIAVIVLIIVWGALMYYRSRLLKLASTDELTCLSNRRAFDDKLQSQLNKKKKTCIFMFDIDSFKSVNDTFGHEAGDEALKLVASTAAKAAGKKSILSRWGGDEFAGYFKADTKKAGAMLEKLRKQVEENPDCRKYGVTLSIGYTQSLENDTINSALRRTDRALYMAKESGKNRVVFLDKMPKTEKAAAVEAKPENAAGSGIETDAETKKPGEDC